jgi:Fe2+ transport system protein B
MLYHPVLAALAMHWKEHGFKWTLFSFGYLKALAWMIATSDLSDMPSPNPQLPFG